MSTQSRRDFLKVSGGGVLAVGAAAALAELSPGQNFAPNRTQAGGSLSVWMTHDNQRCAPAAPIRWSPASAPAGQDTVVLKPQNQFQEILGFGAAFTDSACYMFNQLSTASREELFHQLFHPSQMSFSVCRTCIGSSDYATKLYSYDDGELDPGLTRFSIAHDQQYILPILR